MELKKWDVITIRPFEEKEIIRDVGEYEGHKWFITNYSVGIVMADVDENNRAFLMIRKTAYKIVAKKEFNRMSVCTIELNHKESLVFLVTAMSSNKVRKEEDLGNVKKALDVLMSMLSEIDRAELKAEIDKRIGIAKKNLAKIESARRNDNKLT